MSIIAQVPIMSAIAITVSSLMNFAYTASKETQANQLLEDLKKEYADKIEKFNKIIRDLNTSNRHVVMYNTTINQKKLQFKIITDISDEMMKAASRNRQLTDKIKKEYALDDCFIVRVEHVKNHCDFSLTNEKTDDQEESFFSTEKRGLIAA